jgi:hypothetical protein
MDFTQKIKTELQKEPIRDYFTDSVNLNISKKIVIPLANFDYVYKHPDTDLEEYYLQQVVKSVSLRVVEKLHDLLNLKKIKPEEYTVGVVFCDYTGLSLFPTTLLMPLLEGYYVANNSSINLDFEIVQQGTIDLDEQTRTQSDFLIINIGVKINGTY